MPSLSRPSKQIARKLGLIALVPVFAVCSSDGSKIIETPPTAVATSVTVSPATMSLLVDGTQTLAATVKDQSGNVMSDQPIEWSTNSPGVAIVSSGGVVTGVGAGNATITATSSGKAGTASVGVSALPAVVTTVAVTPATASVVAGANVALSATVKDAQGTVIAGQTVTWATSSASVATVNSNGLVTGVTAGTATITATSSGKSGTAAVTVTAQPPVVASVTVSPPTVSISVGATTGLSATVKDAAGNTLSGQTVSWSTTSAAVASVNSTGTVTGVSAGTATITATSSGKSGTSSVTVTAAPPPPPPPSGTLLFQENFEDASIGSRGWYDNTSVVLSTTEHITGSNSSAQYRYLQGATTPTSGGAQRHKFTPSSSVYISYYVKYSSNWVGSNHDYHPHEFYLMSTLDGDYDGPSNGYLVAYLEQNYQNGGIPLMALQDNKSVNYSYGPLPHNLVGVTEDRSTTGCNGIVEANMYSECFDIGGYFYSRKQLTGPVSFQPGPGAGYKNDWNLVEAYYQLNTIANGIGQADGVMQYWFNGKLVIDRHDILYRTGAHPTIQFSQLLIGPYIGDGSPVDQSMWVDNLRIATSRIP